MSPPCDAITSFLYLCKAPVNFPPSSDFTHFAITGSTVRRLGRHHNIGQVDVCYPVNVLIAQVDVSHPGNVLIAEDECVQCCRVAVDDLVQLRQRLSERLDCCRQLLQFADEPAAVDSQLLLGR